MSLKSRRTVLSLVAALPFSAPARARTPSAAEGPFYPTPRMRFADADNNLVRVQGTGQTAAGEVLILQGRVLDQFGQPVSGARIEIWQCDSNGIYLHTRDRTAEYDGAFQGFGHVVTEADGLYAFRTIKPVSYPGRTPHIHVKAFADGRELTTQFYLDGHPSNRRDGLFRRLSRKEAQSVSMVLQTGSQGLQCEVDIHL